MILVVGGTGVLGSRVALKLLERGEEVRVLTRSVASERAAELWRAGAVLSEGDLCDPPSFALALRDVDRLVISVQALAGPGTSRENNPHTCDRDGVRALIDDAEAAGVKRLVFVSIAGASPDAGPEFVRIKYETEQHLRRSALAWTIIRPAAFMEVWAEMIGRPVINGERAMVFGDGDHPVNFVSADDVAEFVALALREPEMTGQVITVGGPQNFTLTEVVSIFEQAVECSAKVRKTPVPLMKTLSTVLRPLNPGLSRQMGMGAWMATSDQAVDMTDTLARFPVKLTRLQDVAARMVAEQPTARREEPVAV